LVSGKSQGTCAPKSRIKEAALYVTGLGPPPDDIIEVQLAERFGWTFSDLAEEDASLVLPAVAASNMVAAYRRVMQALKVHKVEGVAPDDWKVYQAFQAVLTEGE